MMQSSCQETCSILIIIKPMCNFLEIRFYRGNAMLRYAGVIKVVPQ